MATKQQMREWEQRVDAFRQHIWHLRDPVNEMEKAELQAELTELLTLTREVGAPKVHDPALQKAIPIHQGKAGGDGTVRHAAFISEWRQRRRRNP